MHLLAFSIGAGAAGSGARGGRRATGSRGEAGDAGCADSDASQLAVAVDAGEASLQHDAVGRKLADNLGTARKARKIQQQAGGDRENKLMQEVRDLGRYPK